MKEKNRRIIKEYKTYKQNKIEQQTTKEVANTMAENTQEEKKTGVKQGNRLAVLLTVIRLLEALNEHEKANENPDAEGHNYTTNRIKIIEDLIKEK